ncbi:MAG: hypothetical protein GY915_01945 [bacterium]|nr:hypothetical protein [bacterium]
MTRQGLIFSLVIHGLFLFFLIVGMPWSSSKDIQLMAPTPVEVIMEKPRTRRVSTPPPSKAKPTPPVEKAPDVPPTPPAKPEPPTPTPEPEAKPDVTPKTPPEPKVAEKPKAEPKPPAAKPEKKLTPQPVAKPKAKPKPQPKEDDFMSVLKNLQDLKAAKKAEEKSDTDGSAEGASDQLTTSDLDALRRQIAGCWNVPAGARDAHNLAVDIMLSMRPDGTVIDAKIVDRPSAPGPFYQVAADSALRAVLSSKCSPLKLPRKKYDQWKNFTMRFSPNDLF